MGASLLCNWLLAGDDLASWIEALSTLAAVLAAMYAGLYAANAWKLEVEREKRWREDQRQGQASLFAAWYATREVADDSADNSQKPEASKAEHGIYVRNASDLPITECLAIVSLYILEPLELTSWPTSPPTSQWLGLVPPSSEPQFYPFRDGLAASFTEFVNERTEFTVELTLQFRDAASVEWSRNDDGQLVELAEPNGS